MNAIRTRFEPAAPKLRGAAELFVDALTGLVAVATSAGRRIIERPRLYQQETVYTSLAPGGQTEVSLSPAADVSNGTWVLFVDGAPLRASEYTIEPQTLTLDTPLTTGQVVLLRYQSRTA
jgi:hypothetical protein